ncbi:MAG: DMT family transporter [Lachnospiraceae bacterium]|uniref:DMT family transporter n=1 Tax=Candidatus Weimeria bifida TaxID=2599074 RepID=A0A6N7IY55_9FIRM|nr:DMT family transporter [Candidatus Weimeria bifida]RRF96732.1 MAG: DMT family transporter [Lachnospiraceae bacterium]
MFDKNKTIAWQNPFVVFIAAFICCLLWGSASPAIKSGYALFQIPADDTPSRILFAGVRFMIAGAMVIAFFSAKNRHFFHPKKTSAGYIAVLMCFQTIIQYIFFYMALAHISGVKGSIINAAGTFFSIFLAVFIFRFEKLNIRKVLGSILGFLGVFIIVGGGSETFGHFSIAGDGAMIIAALSSAFAGCFVKKFSSHDDPAALSGWQFLCGGTVMMLIGLAAGGKLQPTGASAIVLIIYMGFISAGAYTIWSILLKYNDVSRITVLGFMNPVLGVLLSALFLNEGAQAFNWLTLLALLLVSAGIGFANASS